MPRKKRVFIIIQLCFAFSYLFWIFLHPYLKEVVVKKSEAVLFESLMENHELFQALSLEDQTQIQNGYQNLLHERHGSYMQNFSVSLFGMVWVVSSLIICFFLLFNIEGAQPVCWLLPMIVLAYGYFIGTAEPPLRPVIFPQESELSSYLVENGTKSGRQKLVDGWNRYLIDQWLHEEPGENMEEQVTRGNFLFNVERVKWIIEKKEGDVTLANALFTPSALQFIFYFIWNIIFAWVINKRSKSEAVLSVS